MLSLICFTYVIFYYYPCHLCSVFSRHRTGFFYRAIANGCSVEFRSGPVGERAGLGADRPGEIGAEDDEFDAYRKRMMLAYRFRPNPLVGGLRTSYTRHCTSEKCSVTSAVFQTV